MNSELTLTTFTPGEAERITGVSTTMQRDWRRRGILAKATERARFDLFDLAELLTLKLLSDRGIGPKAAAEVVDWCGYGIAYHTLDSVDAYEGDHLRTNEARGLTDIPLSDAERAFITQTIEAAGLDYEVPTVRWSDKADWLRGQIYRARTRTGVIPGSTFIWWADDSHTFHTSVDEAKSEMTTGDPRLAGPVVVLDFKALAYMLSERAGRAFVHVEFPDLPPVADAEPTA
jgi:DNA-binding transcriptional MerR regulator